MEKLENCTGYSNRLFLLLGECQEWEEGSDNLVLIIVLSVLGGALLVGGIVLAIFLYKRKQVLQMAKV